MIGANIIIDEISKTIYKTVKVCVFILFLQFNLVFHSFVELEQLLQPCYKCQSLSI